MEFPEVVELNVGGRYFSTSLATLTKYPDSMLAAMFSGRHNVTKDRDGRYFIDVDGDDFFHILKFLRFQKTPPLKKASDIFECAEYFGLTELKTALSVYMPIKSLALFDKVKQTTSGYEYMLKTITDKLSSEPIRSASVFLTFKKGGECTPSSGGHTFLSEYVNVDVLNNCQSTQQMMVIAAALINDLKTFGVFPEDETIYKPFQACTCTMRRKVRLNI